MKFWHWFIPVFGLLFLSSYYIGAQTVNREKLINYHVASYPQKDYYLGLEQPDYEQNINEKIHGGIVSHHLLTAEDMGRFFAEFSDQNINTVVLIGPNHFSIDKPKISISRYTYDTPWGKVEPDLSIVDSLVASGVAINNENPFTYEHSMSAVVPFIAHHLPKAKLVPIVLRRETNPLQLDDLVAELLRVLPEDAIVIASVDFSHHLNRMGANFHDAASYSAIKSFDLERIFNLEIDSPPTIYFLLSYLEARGAKTMRAKNTNSTQYTGNLASEDVTSYLFAHFTAGEVERVSVVTTLHFGDMMFDRGVKNFMEDGGNPFEQIKGVEGNFLRGVDSIVANLEGPITDGKNCKDKEVVFRFPGETSRLLRNYIDGVTLANNHSQDCFSDGQQATLEALDNAGVYYIDDEEKIHVVEVGDMKVALIGINEIGRKVDSFAAEFNKIKQLKLEYDQVVVHMHWGYELATAPSAEQQIIAHNFVDAGADIIIGHHPHVIQPVERYQDSLIFYSLGNFIFDQPALETRRGIGVGLVHEKDRIGAYVFPYFIEKFQPKLLSYSDSEAFCKEFLRDLQNQEDDVCFTQLVKSLN